MSMIESTCELENLHELEGRLLGEGRVVAPRRLWGGRGGERLFILFLLLPGAVVLNVKLLTLFAIVYHPGTLLLLLLLFLTFYLSIFI